MDVPLVGTNGALGASNGSAGGIGIRRHRRRQLIGRRDRGLWLDSQTVGAPGRGLIFQNSFNFDGSFASLTSSEQTAYATDIERAEYDYRASSPIPSLSTST